MRRVRSGAAGGVALAAAGVVGQLLLEVTLGRLSAAPDIVALVLMYLTINRGGAWSTAGAFWAGAATDMLLHQPLGCTSLGLILGLRAGRLVLDTLPGDSRPAFVVAGVAAAAVTDGVFVAAATRPLLTGIDAGALVLVPRVLATLAAAVLLVAAVPLVGLFRAARTA